MAEFWNLLISFSPLFLLALGYVAGKTAESNHYQSIHAREKNFQAVPTVTTKTLSDPRPVREATLVVGSVVVSIDYYKRFLAALRNLFGGEVRAYSPLLDRGRREALLRMKESCPHADLFLNCRLETASIFKGKGKATGSVEIIAYSTAVVFQK